MEESIAMLRAAYKDGTRRIIATAHAAPGEEPFPMEAYQENLAQLDAYCRAEGIMMELYPGCEIFYSDAVLRNLQEGKIPTLANSRYVLLEFLESVAPDTIFDAARILGNGGYVAVIAHCERYQCLVKNPKLLGEMKAAIAVRLQMNASTVLRQKGFWQKRFVRRVLAERWIDYVATDAHDTYRRPTCLRAGYEALCACTDETYAKAVLNGEGIFL